jgi:hypothetical protein
VPRLKRQRAEAGNRHTLTLRKPKARPGTFKSDFWYENAARSVGPTSSLDSPLALTWRVSRTDGV